MKFCSSTPGLNALVDIVVAPPAAIRGLTRKCLTAAPLRTSSRSKSISKFCTHSGQQIDVENDRTCLWPILDVVLSRWSTDYFTSSTSLGRQVLAKNGSSGL